MDGQSQGSPGGAEGLMGVIYGDSSAANAISERRGCGKLKHIHTGQLWIQEKVEAEELTMRRLLGTENPADLYTKHLASGIRQDRGVLQ